MAHQRLLLALAQTTSWRLTWIKRSGGRARMGACTSLISSNKSARRRLAPHRPGSLGRGRMRINLRGTASSNLLVTLSFGQCHCVPILQAG